MCFHAWSDDSLLCMFQKFNFPTPFLLKKYLYQVETSYNDVISFPFLNQVNGGLGRGPFKVGQ